MAARTPSAAPALNDKVFGGNIAVTGVNSTTATKYDDTGFVLRRFYFADVDDADTWASGYNGLIRGLAWQADDIDDDNEVAAYVATAAHQANGTVTFAVAAAATAKAGWLWVLLDPSLGQPI